MTLHELLDKIKVELISPGHLPNHLTIQEIEAGNSNIRNPILASFAFNLLSAVDSVKSAAKVRSY